ncbi:MAG TPA: HisA/HisF-related TIM barrel protein, partial [Rhodocyclaceae bacterium]|nr:HisA/HisF-related TIM barrel protein [Rhodocyclaceae bacterium]
LNTAALEDPGLVERASRRFGAQCIVVSIDARRREDGSYEVFADGGRLATGRSPAEWAHEVEQLGAGEILLNSI